MAKVQAPLMSMQASGALGKTLVFFPWKGLKVVRGYVVPANPNSSAQQTQRGFLGDAVDLVHAAQIEATHPLDADDVAAYSLRGTTRSSPRTWFNEVVKEYLDQQVAGLKAAIFRDGEATPGSGSLAISMYYTKQTDGANDITAGNIIWGTSKSALINTEAATIAAGHITCTVSSLPHGTKIFYKFAATLHAHYLGAESGIYYGTPT